MNLRPVDPDALGAARRYVLFGLFGTGNIGNDATLQVTLHHLRRLDPGASIHCICNELPDFARAAGVEAIPLNPLVIKGRWRIGQAGLRNAYAAVTTLVSEPARRARMRRILAGATMLVFVGTGVFDDFGLLPWDMPAWLLGWSRAAEAEGVPVHLLAVGAGPIRNRLNRWLMRRAILTAQRRSLRDKVSRDFLLSLGVDAGQDPIAPDLVFGLPLEWIHAGAPGRIPPRVVGLGVMGYFGWEADRARGRSIYRAYIQKLERFLRWLLERGYQVRLLVGEMPTDEMPLQDLVAAVDPAGSLRASGALTTPSDFSFAGLLAEVAQCDLVVASRFHNLISAFAIGRPGIAIGYASKFDALADDMGLADMVQHIESFDVDRLERDFLVLQQTCATASARVASQAQRNRYAVEQVFESHLGRHRMP